MNTMRKPNLNSITRREKAKTTKTIKNYSRPLQALIRRL